MIAAELDITPRAAPRLVEELNLREMTGRGDFERGVSFDLWWSETAIPAATSAVA